MRKRQAGLPGRGPHADVARAGVVACGGALPSVLVVPSYLVERAQLPDARGVVLALGHRNLSGFSEARYAKYYETNPLGLPVVCLARTEPGGPPVGMAALIPIELSVSGTLVRAGIAADFAVDAEHRGLGPALQLQRALLARMPEEGLEAVIGLPNAPAEPVFRRLRFRELGRFSRFVKPLRTGVLLDRQLGRPVLGAVASALVDPLLPLVTRERRAASRACSLELAEAFDERFSPFFEHGADTPQVAVRRSVALLNWKYGLPQEPANRLLAALSRDGSVVGYAVVRERNGVLHVLELQAAGARAGLSAVLSGLARYARAQRAGALSLRCLDGARSLTSALRPPAFFERDEQRPLLVHVPEPRPGTAPLLEPRHWLFLEGDADL